LPTDAAAAPDVAPDDTPAPAVKSKDRRLLGVILVIAATMLFAINDATNKHLLATYDVPLIAAMRYIGQTLWILALLGPSQGRKLVKTQRTFLVIVRSLCLVVASLFFGLALQRMPLAETTSIVYLAPILVVLLAGPLLGERIGALGWVAAFSGFAGVIMVVRPGGGLDPIGVALAASNVGASVAYYLLSRILAKTEQTLAMLFYSALVGGICFGLAAPFYWFGSVPSLLDLGLFASLGITAGIGHYCFTAAYRYAEASLLAPATYMHLLWAGALGWLAFGQLPDAIGIAGMVVIGVAGVLAAVRSRLKAR
jgi:drug/metabolite transporter (DMT)-like permease